jgi:subtilisin family serine protease
MVAAAGNDGELLKSTGIPEQDYLTMFYPASYPQVIGVAAMDNESGAVKDRALLTRAQFSNYGEDLVSVAAVGTSVMTTVPYMPVDQVPYAFYTVPNYTRLDGTSFACPQVVGTAALILSLNADLKPLDVRRMIENTAFPTGGPDENHNNVDDYLGHGIIDVGAAVAAGSGKTSLQENGDFRVGVFPSPLFVDDVMVIVECKRSSDGAPSVTYFVNATAENGSVAMERLPSQTDTWVGQFRTNATGGITINVSGSLGGYPLDPISFVYSLGD